MSAQIHGCLHGIFLSPAPCLHITLKIEFLFRWDMGKGKGWDEGTRYTTNARSQQLACSAKPFPFKRSLLSLNLMKAAPSNEQNIFTYHHKSSQGTDVRTAEVSSKTCTKWARQGWSPKQQEMNTFPTEIPPDLGKSTLFITISVVWCYSDQINRLNVLSCLQATMDVTWTFWSLQLQPPWWSRKHHNVCSAVTPLFLLHDTLKASLSSLALLLPPGKW